MDLPSLCDLTVRATATATATAAAGNPVRSVQPLQKGKRARLNDWVRVVVVVVVVSLL